MKINILKTVLPLVVGALAGMIVLVSCEKRTGVNEEPLLYSEISDRIPCMCLSYDTVTIVNSSSELKVLCANAPDMNFDDHSLLLTSGISTSGIDIIEDTLITNDGINYELYITIKKDMTTQPTGWQRYYWTPKIKNTNNLKYIIKYI